MVEVIMSVSQYLGLETVAEQIETLEYAAWGPADWLTRSQDKAGPLMGADDGEP